MIRFYVNALIYKIRDAAHAIKLSRTRDYERFPAINNEVLEKMKVIYASAYPEIEHGFLDVTEAGKSLNKHLACHASSQIYYLLTDSWYVLLVDRFDCLQILEFAAINGRCRDFLKVIKYLKDNFGERTAEAIARDNTSYPLLIALERRGTIEITENIEVIADGEPYHSVRFKSGSVKRRTTRMNSDAGFAERLNQSDRGNG